MFDTALAAIEIDTGNIHNTSEYLRPRSHEGSVADPEVNLGGVSRGPKGRVGRVREGCTLLLVGVWGASPGPRENFEKMVQSGV